MRGTKVAMHGFKARVSLVIECFRAEQQKFNRNEQIVFPDTSLVVALTTFRFGLSVISYDAGQHTQCLKPLHQAVSNRLLEVVYH